MMIAIGLVAAGGGAVAWTTIFDRFHFSMQPIYALLRRPLDPDVQKAVDEADQHFDQALENLYKSPDAKLGLNNAMSEVRSVLSRLMSYPRAIEQKIVLRSDLAVGEERYAYIGSHYRKVSWIDLDRVCQIRIHGGTDIRPTPPRLRGPVYCTEIADPAAWERARKAYDENYAFLVEDRSIDWDLVRKGQYISDAAAALRNVGYFYMCDSILKGMNEWSKADAALDRIIQLTKGMSDLRDRRRNAATHLALEVAFQSSLNPEDCTAYCGTLIRCPEAVDLIVGRESH